MLRVIICTLLVSLMSACATVNTAKPSDQDPKVKTAKINAQLGIAYLERHNLHRAKQKLLLALEQAPNIPETWYSMAYFLEASGNKNDASIYYQKAVALDPKRGDAQNNYGTFLCRNGEYRESLEHFMMAVKDPSYLDPAGAYENAGLCAMKIPDNKQAAKFFAKAVAQDPSRSVSVRRLNELNKSLAQNEVNPSSASVLPAQKRIAYSSLRHHHDEDEDDAESGLVKIPDLMKLKQASATASSRYTPAEHLNRPVAKLRHLPVEKLAASTHHEKLPTKHVAFKSKQIKEVAVKTTIKSTKVKLAAKPKQSKQVASAKSKAKVNVKAMSAVKKKSHAREVAAHTA